MKLLILKIIYQKEISDHWFPDIIGQYLINFMKNIVITGGNSGIGLETARGLYGDGHTIIIGSRN